MIKIKYIFNLLSISNMRYRIAFFLPWIGIFIGTTMLLLVNGIMHGMEEEIFSSLNNLKKGYEIKSFSNKELESILSYLDENRISYEIVKTRDIIISNNDDYMLVNMLITDGDNNLNNITIGAGIANQLQLEESDSVLIISPLDIDFSSMKVPTLKYMVDSIYAVPVVDFDRRYVFANNSPTINMIYSDKKVLIKKELSSLELSAIKKEFKDIDISYWKDNYLELISAIQLEKIMYSTFAYMLVLISCLGNFTISNFIITNKLKEISILNVIGFDKLKIKKIISIIMLFFSFFSSILGLLFFIVLIKFNLLEPLTSNLFPIDLFYNFSIKIDAPYFLLILVLNLITVYFSSLMAINVIEKEKIIDVIKEN